MACKVPFEVDAEERLAVVVGGDPEGMRLVGVGASRPPEPALRPLLVLGLWLLLVSSFLSLDHCGRKKIED
jgi:hypothetical protein